jgi:hypothetical protein
MVFGSLELVFSLSDAPQITSVALTCWAIFASPRRATLRAGRSFFARPVDDGLSASEGVNSASAIHVIEGSGTSRGSLAASQARPLAKQSIVGRIELRHRHARQYGEISLQCLDCSRSARFRKAFVQALHELVAPFEQIADARIGQYDRLAPRLRAFNHNLSWSGTERQARVTTGLDPVVHAERSSARRGCMDCRVKPGNDQRAVPNP